jgi:hypothetical protein
MGACFSGMTAETKRSNTLDLRMAIDKEDAASVVKVLLLGSGEAGKSTLFKQFRILFGKNYTDHDRQAFLPAIRNNTLAAMKILIARPEANEGLPNLQVRPMREPGA